ncbi:MAG: OsmC family protein [Thermoguttaceae bacterium]
MTVTLDRMIHTNAIHHELGKEIGLEGCCAFGGKGLDLNPIDLMAMGLASCLMIVMAKSAEGKGLDLTGTWAETGYTLKDYKIDSFTITIHSPFTPSKTERAFLEQDSHRCPVYLSVKDSVNVKVAFEWGEKAAPATKKAYKSCSQCA